MPCFTYVVPVEKTNAQLIISQAFETIVCTPTGIEPISTEPESVILSIELRRQNRTAHKVATFSALLQIFVLFSAEKERENYLQGGCRCRKPAEKFFASFLYQILLDASCRLAVRALFRGRMACDNH